MPEYLSPGVYVEEVDAGPKPIEGVSTSTTGAVGVTLRGPTSGKPELVTSYAEFERKFGGDIPEPALPMRNRWALNPAEGGRWWQFALSVRGFFDNGGQRLYVKRVFSGAATAASAAVGRGLIAEIDRDAEATDRTLVLRHLIDVEQGMGVRILSNGNRIPTPPNSLTVNDYSLANRTIDINADPGQSLTDGKDFIEIQPVQGPGPGLTTVEFIAKARGRFGNALSVRVRPMLGPVLNILPDAAIGGAPKSTQVDTTTTPAITLTADAAEGDTDIDVSGGNFQQNDSIRIQGTAYTVTAVNGNTITIDPAVPAGGWPTGTEVTPIIRSVIVADATGFANNDRILVNGHEYTISNVDQALNSFDVAPSPPAGTIWPDGINVKRLLMANTPGSNTIAAWGAVQLYPFAVVELDNGANKEQQYVVSVNGDTVTLSGALQNQYYEGHRLRVIEGEVAVRLTDTDTQEIQDEELFQNLRFHEFPNGDLNYVENRINVLSRLIDADASNLTVVDTANTQVNVAALPVSFTAQGSGWVQLSGGADNIAALSPDDFVGVDGGTGNRTGIQALQDIEEISICLAPGMWSSTIHQGLIQHCEQQRYRFAVLDPQNGLSIEGIRSVREPIDTKYAAIYYPWINVRNPSIRRFVEVAPSGHMVGIYARVDVERGVHKAPANEVIRGIRLPNAATGVSGLAQDISKREQDMLNPVNINVLRYFPGRGQRVWGARVITSDSAWKYINVRRLFIMVEHSIDRGTQWVVFEPNDEPLWARVRQTISNFLTTVWRNGALQGTTADEAFFVRCDRSTMTQDDIDNGRLICVIGIAPVKPAEFVIFRIQQKTMDTEG